MRKIALPSFCLLFLSFTLSAQIISTDPIFPRPDQPLTITFDASKGSGGLANLPGTADVYAHTGLVTNASGPGSWTYVVGNWATDDSRVKMTRIGTSNLYQLTLGPSLREWYENNNNDGASIPQSIEIEELGFVFRNVDGSMEGKTEENGDIFLPVYDSGSQLLTAFFEPQQESFITQLDETINVFAAASAEGTMRLFDNGNLLTEVNNDSLSYTMIVTEGGFHEIVLEVEAGAQTAYDTFSYIINPDLTILPPPSGTELGITYLDDTSVRLALYAPNKDFVYVLGDFNDWTPTPEYYMNRQPVGRIWWLDITGLTPGEEYAFQYWVDGEIRTADPYSALVLDDRHDGGVPEENFPNLHPYPFGKTTDYVSLLQPGTPEYDWQVNDFQKPPQERLVVYELLVRDFLSAQNYQTLTDTLDYLQRLGINAIELMPVNEFNGNLSWGYDPTFHMALDKYYGTPDAFKALVDACHERGIAVILDAVFNHAHERNPFCKLYWNTAQFRPASSNPWLNEEATHAFNVFFDFNHESDLTQDYFSRVLRYWVDEYRVDGFRLDLSKGLTQNENGPFDAGAFDASRIAILKNYGDEIWNLNPETYMILEHFAANSEERELSDYGFMLWGNMNYNYNEATMGYPSSDFSGVAAQVRGWDDPHLVGYMESHDEERLMFKNLEYGNSAPGYDVTDLTTALQRQELAANFLLAVPGPKMIWQFGELGYDHSIFTCTDGTVDLEDTGCKLSPKPIRWDYLEDERRVRLFEVFSTLNDLRDTYEVFHTDDFELDFNQPVWKQIKLNSPDMNVNVIGHFGLTPTLLFMEFQHTGTWYDYYTGDSLEVTSTSMPLFFQPGEYRLYTDQNIGQADIVTATRELPAALTRLQVFPNPTSGQATLILELAQSTGLQLQLFDLNGRLLWSRDMDRLSPGAQQHPLPLPTGLQAGQYLLQLNMDGERWTETLVIH